MVETATLVKEIKSWDLEGRGLTTLWAAEEAQKKAFEWHKYSVGFDYSSNRVIARLFHEEQSLQHLSH